MDSISSEEGRNELNCSMNSSVTTALLNSRMPFLIFWKSSFVSSLNFFNKIEIFWDFFCGINSTCLFFSFVASFLLFFSAGFWRENKFSRDAVGSLISGDWIFDQKESW